jgi:hypothetical protein
MPTDQSLCRPIGDEFWMFVRKRSTIEAEQDRGHRFLRVQLGTVLLHVTVITASSLMCRGQLR